MVSTSWRPRTRRWPLITATNYLPLMERFYRSHRKAVFTLVDSIQDDILITAAHKRV